ncbi:hypothetical protein BDF20DRAFT_874106 [Mycotypha africana]|uniref:uncharacterized protein n=1 Tax=Mycotypha africana TaxID=64632 RepID=UPI002300111A|nr:uncharacterized protein BDF20DRAFT_874106 [Mycotypha africana]KAI8977312.1 hypothetical protein BDF20DRAFT_874106 [Mycotypha africana]
MTHPINFGIVLPSIFPYFSSFKRARKWQTQKEKDLLPLEKVQDQNPLHHRHRHDHSRCNQIPVHLEQHFLRQLQTTDEEVVTIHQHA